MRPIIPITYASHYLWTVNMRPIISGQEYFEYMHTTIATTFLWVCCCVCVWESVCVCVILYLCVYIYTCEAQRVWSRRITTTRIPPLCLCVVVCVFECVFACVWVHRCVYIYINVWFSVSGTGVTPIHASHHYNHVYFWVLLCVCTSLYMCVCEYNCVYIYTRQVQRV